MKLYLRYIDILFKAQLQYRTSFILLCIEQFFAPFSVFFGFYLMFERFGSIAGWNFYEAALCFSVIHFAFSIAVCAVRGFDMFSSLIVQGEFDRLLLRPRNLVLQVLGSRFDFIRIGRFVQSLVVCIIALSGIDIVWTPIKITTLLLMILSGAAIFSGIFILTSALCFWTVQGLEVANVFTDGGRETAQYPLDIYKKGFKNFFTFVIPFGMVNYIPLMYLLGKTKGNPILYALSPLYGILFLVPCIAFWYYGVTKYKSAGS